MVATRTWRPTHSVDGPFRARLDDISDLNQVFSDAFTERYRRDGMVGVRESLDHVLRVRYDEASGASQVTVEQGPDRVPGGGADDAHVAA